MRKRPRGRSVPGCLSAASNEGPESRSGADQAGCWRSTAPSDFAIATPEIKEGANPRAAMLRQTIDCPLRDQMHPALVNLIYF